jgi:hypothetical protein
MNAVTETTGARFRSRAHLAIKKFGAKTEVMAAGKRSALLIMASGAQGVRLQSQIVFMLRLVRFVAAQTS